MLFIKKKMNMIKWLKFLKYATCVSDSSIFIMFVNCEFNPDLNEIFTKSLEIALKNLRKVLWHYLKSFKSYIVSSFSGKDFLTHSVNGFIRVYDGTRYLVLFGPEKYGAIYSRIRYLISLRSVNTYVISHNYAKSKFVHMILSLYKKYLLFIMFLVSRVLISIKLTMIIIYS